MKNILQISNLQVIVDQKIIIENLNLTIEPGLVHVLMGPNGSGKSTLAYALMGHPLYSIARGSICFKESDITTLAVDKRAQLGIFLAFQKPYEIPGVTVFNFLREAYLAITKKIVSAKEFQELLYTHMELLSIDVGFAHRPLNHGFSGGQKKQLELLQLLLLKPSFAILDEIDSGLDVDAIALVGKGLEVARKENPDLSLLIITHYPRLLKYIHPDFVHIMNNGRIQETGSASLVQHIEQCGYDAYKS